MSLRCLLIARVVLLVGPVICLAAPVGAQQSPTPVEAQPQSIRQEQPPFFVRAAVDRENGIYREREAISLQVACEENAYVYVLYQQADGEVFLVFPNAVQQDNRLPARQSVRIPAQTDRFEWVVGPPFGKEVIKVIAAREPITQLDDPVLRKRVGNSSGK